MLKTLRFLVLALTTATTATSWSATTLTLRPNGASDGTVNGDAFVTTGPTGNLSGFNYGGAGALAVSSPGSAAGTFASFLRFDTAAARSAFDATYGVGGWVLDSVSLQLTTSNANNPIFNANAAGSFSVRWIPADTWVEGAGTPSGSATAGVTWAEASTLTAGGEAAGTFPIASVADGVTATYDLAPSAGLLGDIAGGGPVSFYLEAAGAGMSAVFNSRSFGNAARNPAFILTASPIPEPGAAGLLVIAALGLMGRRRA